jgi:hypothetical protein
MDGAIGWTSVSGKAEGRVVVDDGRSLLRGGLIGKRNEMRTTSPKLYVVVFGVVRIVPNSAECFLGQTRSSLREMPVLVPNRQEVDEVFNLRDPFGRKASFRMTLPANGETGFLTAD